MRSIMSIHDVMPGTKNDLKSTAATNPSSLPLKLISYTPGVVGKSEELVIPAI